MMTTNPHRDAEVWNSEQDRRAAEKDRKQAAAFVIVERELEAMTAEQWNEQMLHHGRYQMSADEVLVSALETDPDTQAAFAKLMTSPAAKELRETLARYHADLCYEDILQPLPPCKVRGLLSGGKHQSDGI